MKFGAVQYCLGKADTMFEVAARLGLDGIELGYGEANDQTTDPARRNATRAAAAAAGIDLPSLMLGKLNNGGWTSEDPAVRDAATDLVLGAIEAAPELGCRVILVPFFFKAAPHSEVEFARVVDGFGEVVAAAAEAGITLGYEGELAAPDVLRLLDEVGSPTLWCYYDVGNAVWLGNDPLAELRMLAGRICQVHFKEFTAKLNDRLLGEGNVPVAEACQVLREIGYDGYYVLETGSFGDPETNSGRQLEFLRQLA